MKERFKHLHLKTITTKLEGVGVIEVILILVIIIGLVLIFRNQIAAIVKAAFASINTDTIDVTNKIAVPTLKP